MGECGTLSSSCDYDVQNNYNRSSNNNYKKGKESWVSHLQGRPQELYNKIEHCQEEGNLVCISLQSIISLEKLEQKQQYVRWGWQSRWFFRKDITQGFFFIMFYCFYNSILKFVTQVVFGSLDILGVKTIYSRFHTMERNQMQH